VFVTIEIILGENGPTLPGSPPATEYDGVFAFDWHVSGFVFIALGIFTKTHVND
jgi:hypothetical protein